MWLRRWSFDDAGTASSSLRFKVTATDGLGFSRAVTPNAKSTLMSSPRLHGLFGANNRGANKKPHPDESEISRSTTRLSFPSSLFKPLSQLSSSTRLPIPSLPRRISPSPVRLGPNFTLFDIEAWSKSPTTLRRRRILNHRCSFLFSGSGRVEWRSKNGRTTVQPLRSLTPRIHQRSLSKTSLKKRRYWLNDNDNTC